MAELTKDKPVDAVATVTLTIDGQSVTVPKGTTVLQAAKSMGIHIPTFCWHPKLKAVGACRMCYVEIERFPKLQVSCATEAGEGMVVFTQSDQVLQGRKAVIEFILLNHPLDCPTCDKGGECDLQNLTFAHGYDDSRFDFPKQRFIPDGVDSTFDDLRIGPEIVLNRNRCILCYKCVRANKEAFGEYDIGAYERGNRTEINAAPGQQVDNPFSGNLVEICPVGALTASDWRYKIRVWLTQTVDSICPFMSSGSNTTLFTERHQDKIFRTTSRPNDDIDNGWLSDITRYGYQIAQSEDRLKQPLIKKGGDLVSATWEEALDVIGERLSRINKKSGRVCIGGLIDPCLDNASLHSFSKLLRYAIGSNNIDYRTEYRMLPSSTDSPYGILSTQTVKLTDIDNSDLILVFGSDLLREHPNEYLRCRSAVSNGKLQLYVMNPYETKASDISRGELVYKIGREEAALAALCFAGIENLSSPSVTSSQISEATQYGSLDEACAACGIDPDSIRELASKLADSANPIVLGGELISRSRDRDVIASGICNLNLVFDLSKKGSCAILPRYANSKGAEALGLYPELPRQLHSALKEAWGEWTESEGHNTDSMMVRMRKEEIDGCIVMGANPVMLYPDREFVRESLERLDFLVVCDMFETETTALADVVLPLSSWAEYDGEYMNLEGRCQRANKAIKNVHQSKPAYEIAELIAGKIGKQLFESDSLRSAEVEKLLNLRTDPSLPGSVLKTQSSLDSADDGFDIPLVVGDDPHHCGHRTEKSNSLLNFCGEAYIELSSMLAEKYSIEDGDSVRVESPVGKIIVSARVSSVIRNNVVFVPRNLSSTQVSSLLMRKRRIDMVRLTKVETT